MDRKKTILMCAAAAAAGVLVGSFVTALIMKQPWKKIEKSSSVEDRGYDVQQCVTLGKYNGLEVSLAVSQEDIDAEIENLQDENKIYEKKTGKVQDGDKIYANWEGYIDGKKVEETSGKDYLEIGGDEWLPGFSKHIVGTKTGKQVSFTLTVPAGSYGDDKIDGKKVTFKVTPQYICGDEIIPDYNDDFVQSISDCKTVSEHKEYLRKQLLSENKADKAEYAWTDVLTSCNVKKYPDDLMEEAKQEVLQGYYDMADLYGMTHDEIFTSFGRENEQDFIDNDLDELAKDSVKETLVAEAIAQKEGIHYSDEDYNTVVEEEYSYNTEKYDNQTEYEKENQSYLKGLALQNAVKSWISDHAKFVEE